MAAPNDDCDELMQKVQAKIKERNAMLQSSKPIAKENPVEIRNSSPKKLESKAGPKIPVKEWKTPVKEWKTPTKQPDQSVKENINKFERIASGSKVAEQKEDYKAVSVKEMKRRFETSDSSAVMPTRGPNPPKSPKVCIPSPKSPKVFPVEQKAKQDVSPNRLNASHQATIPAKSPKVSTFPVEQKATQDVSQMLEQPPRQQTPVIIEEHELEGRSLSVEVPPSPATLFDNRLRQTMEPITPRRARLMDEINEDYQKHSNSMPRRPTGIMNFEEDANDEDDSTLVSLKEYRQETLERMAGTSSGSDTIEKLNYTPVQAFDSTDSNAPKRNTDRIRQLDEFIEVSSAQHEQAKKALSLIINKSERSEEELVAANHILLTHRVVLEAALRMRKNLDRKSTKKMPEMKAAFTFKSVTFELNPEFLHDICAEGASCYFVIVIGHNENTRSSAPISYHMNSKCRITFDDFYCTLDNVEPGFEIYVEVYMLKIPRIAEKRHTFVDTVGTLLRGEKQRTVDLRFTDSQFQRIGIASINHENMNLRHIQARTIEPLAPRFDVIFDHHVMESTHHLEGYLRRFETVAGVGNWAMEYMTFNSWFLDSYTTQREKVEGKSAIRSINLRRCLEVAEVTDSACYPNAFFINYESEEGQKEKMLLAARSKEEQDQWLKVLKGFVDGLKYWN